MKLKESYLRAAIRNILLSELFVSPRDKKKTSAFKRSLDSTSSKGFYDDDEFDGFGEFDEEDDAESAE